MKKSAFLSIYLIFAVAAFSQQSKTDKDYFPAAKSWQKKTTGFDMTKLQQAIEFAKANETNRPRSMKESQVLDFGKEPFPEPLGVFADRGDPTGVIIHKGYIVAEWGEPARVDMTHSVAKSILSSIVGIAVDKGLIKSEKDTVSKYISVIEWYNPQAGGAPQLIRPFSTPHGMLCSGKPVTGKALYGISLNGATALIRTALPGARVPVMNPAKSGNITMCG